MYNVSYKLVIFSIENNYPLKLEYIGKIFRVILLLSFSASFFISHYASF